ncbi:hypothetical protein [Occallatibacter savannae]|uniref:hypothetical protein n=1 Tax=Occallatibacter savannae TaxID=1002691 RepID=UPI000D69CA3C|nr:hypothetical protein [Occallatibacter savannae]
MSKTLLNAGCAVGVIRDLLCLHDKVIRREIEQIAAVQKAVAFRMNPARSVRSIIVERAFAVGIGPQNEGMPKKPQIAIV